MVIQVWPQEWNILSPERSEQVPLSTVDVLSVSLKFGTSIIKGTRYIHLAISSFMLWKQYRYWHQIDLVWMGRITTYWLWNLAVMIMKLPFLIAYCVQGIMLHALAYSSFTRAWGPRFYGCPQFIGYTGDLQVSCKI